MLNRKIITFNSRTNHSRDIVGNAKKRSVTKISMNKLEYIAKQISKSKKKIYEHYVITRIWHLLNDLSIKFVTQQYVVRPNGRALTDLFFPQLGLHIEVNEPYHLNQTEQDKLREQDIINATNHRILRVDVSQDILCVNKQIDEVIKEIKERKGSIPDFKNWDIDAESTPKTYIDKGCIELKDNCSFKTMVDAANCFGHNIKPKGIWRGGVNHPNEGGKLIWFPKLYKNKDWENSISLDENIITEISANSDNIKPHIDSIIQSNIFNRIIFARVKGPLGDIMYRYKGEYKLNENKTNYNNGLIWERIKEKSSTYPQHFV